MSAIEPIERINALLALYRESHYDVALRDGSVATIRIGALPPEPILRWFGRDRIAVYMTACNPRSQSLPAEENERRLERLRMQLRERRCRFLEGAGHIPGESWREPSLLVRGLGDADLDELVGEHEQNCIVIVRRHATAALRLYRPEWQPATGPLADVEWARAPA